ncbi:SWIM zinc finger family protein [Streptomyces sp. NPDC003717]|uniref:SWIM zinc finger family protein n=1 Tax=Streptomyces sp. NPDC003717 TaxID=3154276 RepID=UPI0033B6C5B1
MTTGPADEARRALRAARGRGEDGAVEAAAAATPPAADERPTEETSGGTPVPGEYHGRRPGDVARAAMRGVRGEPGEASGGAAVSGAVGQETSGAPQVPEEERGRRPGDGARAALRDARGEAGRGEEIPDEAVPDTPSSDGDRGNRPGDVAREALRAARRQARAEAPAPARRRAPRPPGPPRDEHEARARDLRRLLTDGFRLPADTEAEPTEDHASGTGRAPATEPASGVGRASGSGAARGTGRASETVRASGTDPARGPGSAREVGLASETGPAHGVDPASGTGDASLTNPAPGADAASVDKSPRTAAPADEACPEAPGGASEPSASREARSPEGRSAAPRTPRSMAAPDRDGELRRTFPPLAPRVADDGRFAETWWGSAWVTALEEGALDAARLVRGRRYAEEGHVDAITVTPGHVLAYVRGSRARPYRVQVRLRTLGEEGWERFLDAAADRPGHIAALLDGELPHDLADCGAPLLPGPGDLAPQCSCPDSGHPCKHAAALCYQTARLLDADPFVLLLLRGRGERGLLDALSRRSAARAARAAQDRDPAPLPGVRAGEALAARTLPPLPPPRPAPPHPEQPPAYPAAPGGPDPFALDQLATDAAARAHALLTTGRDPVGGLTLWQDAVRLAAARPGSGLTAGTRALYASLATAAHREPADLSRAVAAWRQGGAEGLAVLEAAWDPPAGRFDRARPLLLAADLPAFRPWRNRLTHPRGHSQLRLGRTGLWYAYESEPGHEDWWPRGTPDLDPVGALTGLGGPETA